MTVDQIQQEIMDLSVKDYQTLSVWLKEHDFERWDKQIEADADTGRLDGLVNDLREEYQAGLTSPL